MKINLILESKNFDDDKMMKEQLDKNPCRLCMLGRDLMCAGRKYCRWDSHREIYIKNDVFEVNTDNIEKK